MSRPIVSRNPWPLAIVAFFVVFIGFLVAFIVFATRQHVDLVSSDYYEQELRYQQQFDRLRRAHEQGGAAVAYDAAQQCILVRLPGTQGTSAAGQIHLYRPSNAALDQRVELALDSQGAQRLDARKLERGLWKVRLQWMVGGQDYSFDQAIILPGRSLL